MTVPRSGSVKPESDRRLSDLVSVGLLTRVFQADVVDAVVAAAGRTELRQRALPARVVTYFAIGMALHSEGSYEDVFAQLTDGLSWTTGWEQSSVFLRRNRLSFKHVHDWVTNRYVICSPASLVPSPVRTRPASWLAGRRLVAIDGTCVDVPDTPANADFSGGRPQVAASSPRSRKRGCVAVTECGTHAIFDAVLGPCRSSEIEMARALAGRLEPGMLVLADRGLYGFKLWSQAAGTGADLLWRVKTTLRPRHVQTLPDGSWLARIVASSGAEPRQHTAAECPSRRLHDRRRTRQSRAISAADDHSRPRPGQRDRTRQCLRAAFGKSRASSTNSNPISADLGRCCARSPRSWCSRRCGGTYAAITPSARSCSTPRRTPGTTPIEYPSWRRCVSPEDRCPTALLPPHNRDTVAALWQCAIGKLTQRLNPARRARANPRVVKRKVLEWAAKRSDHARWPQPADSPHIAIQLLN